MGLGVVVPRPMFPDELLFPVQHEEPVKRRILLLSNPIHTDIALPADPDVLNALSFVTDAGLDLTLPGVEWVVIGWGGRSFYTQTPTWDDLKLGPVLRAITIDQSVMHVARAGSIELTGADVLQLEVSESQLARLLEGITGSFSKTNGKLGQPVSGLSYPAHDAFFPAEGLFNVFLGCNAWTARMLRMAGFHTGVWTPLPVLLTFSLYLHSK